MAKTTSSTQIKINQALQICTQRVEMDTFYKNEIGKIRSLVFKFGDLGVDAEDIFQDSFLKAKESVLNGNYNGKSSFAAYFYTICKNMCIETLKNRKEIPYSEVIEKTVKEEKIYDNSDLIRIMLKVKKNISEVCKQIINLRYGIGINNRTQVGYVTNYNEIAKKLNISNDNARKRFSNCIKNFRELIMETPEFQSLEFNAENNFHSKEIGLIIAGEEKIHPIAVEKNIKGRFIWGAVNKEISRLWIESEKYLD